MFSCAARKPHAAGFATAKSRRERKIRRISRSRGHQADQTVRAVEDDVDKAVGPGRDVADAADKCPNRAEDIDGFDDADGCPDIDNDADGILDDADKCPVDPETKNGFMDEDGCPDVRPAYVFEDATPIVFYDIRFRSGSDELLAESFPILDDIVASLEQQPTVRVRIEGHTDDYGDDDTNLLLSQKRALAVLNYVVDHGVAKTRLEYEGYGETRPVDSNGTTEGRARNRRVELHVIGHTTLAP